MMRRNKRYTESDIIKLVSVVMDERLYYKTWGNLHQSVRAREINVKPRSRPMNCPSCGSTWNQIVCDDCGQTGV
jgi:hypothetical protein